jgi:thioredoxin reductase (NADPH)
VKELQDAGVHLAEVARAVTREGRMVIVKTRDGHRHELDVLYPALGCQVNSELAASLGVQCDSTGMIGVDTHQRTGVKGLYAAGDVVTDLHQISVANAHAAIAATDIHNCLAPNPR